MPSNTTYKPTKTEEFQSDQVNFNGMASFGSASESQTTSSDLTLMDDHLMTGGNFLVKNGKFGDKIKLQVVHPTYGVVNQFVTDYGVQSDSEFQFSLDLSYPAKLATGLKLRVVYISTSEVGQRDYCINYLLHKILF